MLRVDGEGEGEAEEGTEPVGLDEVSAIEEKSRGDDDDQTARRREVCKRDVTSGDGAFLLLTSK